MNPQTAAVLREPASPIRILDSGPASSQIRVILQADTPGVVEAPSRTRSVVAIHVGRPVRLECRHGNEKYSGLAIHGDIDIIPSGMPARWEMKETDTALLLSISTKFLERLAQESGLDPRGLQLRDRFHIRDRQIEHIGWALMAEMEQGYPNGSLFLQSLATALGVQLLRNHSSLGGKHASPNGGLPARKLRQVVSYIEDNLGEDLSLEAIARIADVSVSHLKVLFRKSLGMPVHQYVIRRRVERAALALRQERASISQVALEMGFTHQSHLAAHMKRILGVSPREIKGCS
ncbi:MAG TPA: AraC family transcriptional regulator [Candidatus Acidoferrales bacterium]|nr:AraC family transcriptional regulator [Candidatus Acidoferrales bacterium]